MKVTKCDRCDAIIEFQGNKEISPFPNIPQRYDLCQFCYEIYEHDIKSFLFNLKLNRKEKDGK